MFLSESLLNISYINKLVLLVYKSMLLFVSV